MGTGSGLSPKNLGDIDSGPVSGPNCSQPLTREAAEALAAKLVEEMIAGWRQGRGLLPEDFLARHPELWEHPEAAADLIYEELCLRQEYGPQMPVEQVLDRFPQWRPQLEVLFDCQHLLGPRRAAPRLPDSGAILGDFLLLAELGRGAHGRVFLASQLSLGDRPMVLKLTPLDAREHLSLARLQHTHIVPLYSVQDHPARGLRALCMPYFGGATLAQIHEELNAQPSAHRTGQGLLDALDRVQARAIEESGLHVGDHHIHGQSAAANLQSRKFLARAPYVQVVCWLGACLADALQYAHERGLVHLDIKLSNVLMAADGQPMLLDFHLAREPILPEETAPQWLGGTPGYLSPEQQAALLAVQRGQQVAVPVDGRSDIYSLGVVLYELLGGSMPAPGRSAPSATTAKGGKVPSEGSWNGKPPPPLHLCNPQVSVGLADVVGKCLAAAPEDRYPLMAALAADLRRHLAHLPLVGVPNRSLVERWRKWRRARPLGLARAGMILAVLAAATAVVIGAVSHFSHRIDEGQTALNDGRLQMAKGEWDGAIRTLERGRSAVHGLPFQEGLAGALDGRLRVAEEARSAALRGAAARELHQVAGRARFLYGANDFPAQDLGSLAARCRAFWENRARIVERLTQAGHAPLDPGVRRDLLDLGIFWADLQERLGAPAGREGGRRKALKVLAQAEALFGTSPILDAERIIHGAPGRSKGRIVRPAEWSNENSSATAWDHYALGRAFLRSGDLKRAADALERAVRQEPQGLWPNFYQGQCAYRQGRHGDAVAAYSVCIGAAPEAASCFYNRALALAALARTEQAVSDYDQALRLDPTLAAAALNRGMLHFRAKRYAAAVADLKRARELGADQTIVSFNLALVHRADGKHAPVKR